jgi:hypothetical protein
MNRKFCILGCVLTFFLLSMTSPAPGQYDDTEKIIELIQNAPPAVQFPDASAVTLLHEITVTVNPDYSSTSEEHLVLKILNDLGKGRYGDLKRWFDKETDSIEVILARTFDKEMNIVEVEEKAINVTTPMALADAAMYSNIQQKVISFPALEGGVTIELKLKKYSDAPEKGEKTFVWETDMFQASDPILSKKHQLIIPLGINIAYTTQNEGLDYSADTVNNREVDTWKTTFSQQIVPEPNMPPFTRIAPRLLYTSAASWDEVSSWFADKFYKHVIPGKKLKKQVEKWRRESADDDELIEKIGLYVIQQVREVQLPLALSGYEPHDAYEVFENKYGDQLDKAVLAAAMFKEAGIEYYPVFINENEAVTAEDMPSLAQFTGIYIYVPREDGEPFWLCTFADHCSFGYFPHGQGSTCLLVKPEGSELIKAYDPPCERNTFYSKTEYRLNSNGDINASMALKLRGYFDFLARLQMEGKKPVEIEQYFQRVANNIGLGSESLEYSSSDPENLTSEFEITHKFRSPEIGIVEGDMMIFELPGNPFDFIYFPYPSLEMRFYDFVLKNDMMMNTEGDIILPAGYQVAYMPTELSLSDDYVDIDFKFEQAADGKAIHYTRNIKLKQKVIPSDDYFEFKELFDEYSKRQNRIILLEKI